MGGDIFHQRHFDEIKNLIILRHQIHLHVLKIKDFEKIEKITTYLQCKNTIVLNCTKENEMTKHQG